ncbi:MAG: hypothetical protein R2726_16205 [Acidimicrobiales bacterium]
MDLHLDDDDVSLLRELLDAAFRDLRMEIADTDNVEYKEGLRSREDRLRALLDQVGGPLPNPA